MFKKLSLQDYDFCISMEENTLYLERFQVHSVSLVLFKVAHSIIKM